MDEAHVRPSNAIGITTNGERDDVAPRYNDAALVEA